MDPTQVPRDLDPRIERSRERVLAAVEDLLAEIGFAELTVEAVAARSGVAKSTIYRHWPGKLALVEATCWRSQDAAVSPPEGPVADRLVAVLTPLATRLHHPHLSRALVALIQASEHWPDVRTVQLGISDAGRARVIAVLRRGIELGELVPDADVEMLCDLLAGYLFERRMVCWEPMPVDRLPTLVELVLRSVRVSD